MANGQSIDEIISKQAFDQQEKLKQNLRESNQLLVDNIISASKLNDVIAKSKSFKEFQQSAKSAALEVEKLNQAQLKTQQLQDKIAASQAAEAEKERVRAAKRLADEQKQIDIEAKRVAALKANTDKIVAEAERERQAMIKKYNVTQQSEPITGSGNGATISSGTTVNAANIAAANAANQASTTTYKQNTQAVDKNTLSKKQLALMEAQAKANTAANTLALKNQAKELNAAKGSLDQRAAALARLQKVFGSLNEAERASPFGQRLSKVIPQLNDQVLALEKSTGKSQRNVGNYLSGAYSGLRTIAQILPGVGIAGIIGFATEPIINYISALDLFTKKISEAVKTRKLLADINLKGAQDAQLEVTQLKVLVDTAKNKTLSDELRYNAAKKLQDQYPQTFKNYTTEDILLGKVDGATLKLTQSIIALARARASESQIAENSSRVLTDEQRILDLQEQRILATTRQSKAQAQFNKDLERAKGNVQALNAVYAQETVSIEQGKIARIDKQINDLAKDREILNTRNLALAKNIVAQQQKGADLAEPPKTKDKKEKIDTSIIDEQRARIEAERNAQKAIYENESETLQARYGGLENYSNLSEQLNQLDAAKKIKLGKAVSVANAERDKEDEKNLIDTNKKRVQISEKAQKELTDIFKFSASQNVQIENDKNAKILESNNEVLENIESRRSEEQSKLDESFSKGLISRRQYRVNSLKIDNEAAKESLLTQIDTLSEIIANEQKFAETDGSLNKKLSKDQRDLTALKIRLSKLGTDKQIEDLERLEAAQMSLNKQLRDSGRELFNSALDFGKAITEASLSRIDTEQKRNEEKTAFEIKQVNDSVLSEQEKNDKLRKIATDSSISADERANQTRKINEEYLNGEEEKAKQINLINARAAAEQKVLDERIRQEKIKQAKFDKAQSIANIIFSTAEAVMKTYAEFGFPVGIPLAIAQGVIGAVQLATVLATPLPQYKHGKGPNDNYSGMAVVGDGYEPELRIDGNGDVSLTPSVPTLTHVDANTQIVGGAELRRLIGLSGQREGNLDLKALADEYKAGNDGLRRDFKKIAVNTTVVTEKGFNKTRSDLNRYNAWKNNKFG